MTKFLGFLLGIVFVWSCGSHNGGGTSELKIARDIGYLTFNGPTAMYFTYPSSEKPQPIKSCTIPKGVYGLGYKSWKVDGYYLVRFSSEVGDCGSQTSGFISDSSPVIHSENLFVPGTTDESLEPKGEHKAGVTTRSVAFFKERENYEKVKTRVVNWFGGTVNGCVLFATNSLRLSGTNIPVTRQIGGDLVTLTTKPFVRHMLDNLKWKKIVDLDSLQPGDIGVTEDKAGYPTYPSHVFTFMGWKNKAQRLAFVNDNQGFMLERLIDGGAGDDRTQFAVRPPL